MPAAVPSDSNDSSQKQAAGGSQPGRSCGLLLSPRRLIFHTGTATPAEQQEVQPMVVDDQPAPAPPNLFTDGIEIIDVEDESKAPTPSIPTPSAKMVPSTPPVYPGGFAIDVCFEASKLPLDVAIFNSARAAGGDEKIRKYLQAVLVIGGTAHIPGMGHALESRSDINLFSYLTRWTNTVASFLPQAPSHCYASRAKHGKGPNHSSPEGS